MARVPKALGREYCREALEAFMGAEAPEEKAAAGKFLYVRLLKIAEVDFKLQKLSQGMEGGKLAKEIYKEFVDRLYGKAPETIELTGEDGEPISMIEKIEVTFKGDK